MASVWAAAALNSVDVMRRLHGLVGHAALIHQDSRGQSALHWACLCNSVECVRYLMQHASESAIFLDAGGKTCRCQCTW
jgi:ankyrin repeat protein